MKKNWEEIITNTDIVEEYERRKAQMKEYVREKGELTKGQLEEMTGKDKRLYKESIKEIKEEEREKDIENEDKAAGIYIMIMVISVGITMILESAGIEVSAITVVIVVITIFMLFAYLKQELPSGEEKKEEN